MKIKFSIIILIGFLCLPAFAQKKIGTISKDNVLFARAINNKPAYIYTETNNNGERLYYINYNNKDYGPFIFVYYGYPNYVSNHMAYLVISMDNKFSIFCDGNIYGSYPVAYTWKFISDKEYLYAANEEYVDIDDETAFDTKIYMNGKELPNVRDILISKKGNQAKVVAEITSKKNYYVEYKNKRYGPYDNEILNIDFLADEETLVYRAEKNGAVYIVVNGKETGPYEDCSYINFSDDKKHYAFHYKNNNKDILVKDGQIAGTYSELAFYRFYEPTGELCIIDFDTTQNEMNLYYAGSTYKNIGGENIFFYQNTLFANKDSIMYLTEGSDFRLHNVFINSKLVQKDILYIYPSEYDFNDYAYVTFKPDYTDYLVYNNKEYSLNGSLLGVYTFNKKDVLYATKESDNRMIFYHNGNEIYKSKPYIFGDTIDAIKTGKDYLFFTLDSEDYGWEQKVYYNGKIYPGSAIDNQLVYVDNGNVYLKKY